MSKARVVKTVLAALLLFVGFGAALAHDLGKPVLLVASPHLQGVYERTVLLAVPVRGQHAGFILNLSTGVKLGELFAGHAPSAKVLAPLHFGGPEMAQAIFAMVRRDPGEPSTKLFGEVFVVASAEAVDRVIERTPNDARYFAGFVGWQPGELAAEIEAGYWHVTEPDASLVFSKDTATMWEELAARLGSARSI